MSFSDIYKLFVRKMHFFLPYSPNIALKSDFLHILQQKNAFFGRQNRFRRPREIGSPIRHLSADHIRSSTQKGYICEVSDVCAGLPQISFENNSITI